MNKDEAQRISISKNYISCLPCLLIGFKNSHADYHHIVSGNKRLGHNFGFPMCLWHHRGEIDSSMKKETVEKMLGVSFAKNKKEFIRYFGHEKTFNELNDYAIELYMNEPWLQLDMPDHIAFKIKRRYRMLSDYLW